MPIRVKSGQPRPTPYIRFNSIQAHRNTQPRDPGQLLYYTLLISCLAHSHSRQWQQQQWHYSTCVTSIKLTVCLTRQFNDSIKSMRSAINSIAASAASHRIVNIIFIIYIDDNSLRNLIITVNFFISIIFIIKLLSYLLNLIVFSLLLSPLRGRHGSDTLAVAPMKASRSVGQPSQARPVINVIIIGSFFSERWEL